MNTQHKKGVLLSFGVVPTVFVLLIIRGFFRRNQEQYRKFAAAGTWRRPSPDGRAYRASK